MASKAVQREQRLKGLPISGGVAVAGVCRFRDHGRHDDLALEKVSPDRLGEERERLQRAVAVVRGRLEALEKVVRQRIGEAEAGIFAAQRAILGDPALEQQMEEALAEGYRAEAAAMQTLDAYEERLAQVDDAYVRERASDIGELKRRLLDTLMNTKPQFLCEVEAHCQRGRNRIIVTEELTPSVALEMDTQEIRGIVTERGGRTSHAAILARAVGIPAVSGIDGLAETIQCGTQILVNGDTGEVVLWPSPETVETIRRRKEAEAVPAIEPVEGLTVMANISLAAEAGEAVAMKAEGVGLYRTELEFFAAGRLLSEDEQVERYRTVVEAMAGQPVYVRLLDVGGDKPSPVFQTAREENPQLGLRGARYLLSRPDLLRTQARALARVARLGPVHVMYPMVIDADQYRELRRLVDEATAGMPSAEALKHGPMFEVPSACLDADRLLAISDFASIGSNDLVQYLFAVDRNNERVAHDSSPDRRVFWQLLRNLASAARRADVPISICGELAGDPVEVPRLQELGYDILSVSVRRIPGVRRAALNARTERSPV